MPVLWVLLFVVAVVGEVAVGLNAPSGLAGLSSGRERFVSLARAVEGGRELLMGRSRLRAGDDARRAAGECAPHVRTWAWCRCAVPVLAAAQNLIDRFFTRQARRLHGPESAV